VTHDLLFWVFFPLQGLPAWMNILVKVNPATYDIAPIRQVILGAAPGSPFGVNLFGHTMSLWEMLLCWQCLGQP